MINVAIIGNNFGKRVHLPAFKLIEDVNISTICTNHNWLDIMKDKNVDAICLSVPPNVSYEILQAAISYKKHIFCEKPLACNLNNAANIVGNLNDDIITAINFEICESRIVKKFKALIENKPFGKIKNINLKWIAKNNNTITHSWKHNIYSGGGVLNNFGSHAINLIEYVLPEKISYLSGSFYPSRDCNLITGAYLEFPSFIGSLFLEASDSPTMMSYLSFDVECETGRILLKNHSEVLKNFSLFTQKRQDEPNPILIDFEKDISHIDGRIELTAMVAQKFINGIKEKKQIRPNIQDGLRVQYLINELISKV